MKIAAITVYCNEAFRLQDWKLYYTEYKNNIAVHVIVNNGESAETPLLKEAFPDSVVLESKGMNLMRAYNTGLEFILKYKDVDAIMQITNDVRFDKDSIPLLYDFLYSDEKLAVVGPVLLEKDSDIVEVFGIDLSLSCITQWWGRQEFPYKGLRISDIPIKTRRVSYVSAGTIMLKRDAIEKMGYQDEALNMYCDERDMWFRLKKLGYYEAVTKNAVAWHQHVNRPGTTERSLYAPFYSSRNSIYIVHKYSNPVSATFIAIESFAFDLFRMIYHIVKGEFEKVNYDKAVLAGTKYGLLKQMDSVPGFLSKSRV